MLAWIRPRVSDMLLCSDACPYHHLKLIGGGASGSGSAADLSSTAYSAAVVKLITNNRLADFQA